MEQALARGSKVKNEQVRTDLQGTTMPLQLFRYKCPAKHARRRRLRCCLPGQQPLPSSPTLSALQVVSG